MSSPSATEKPVPVAGTDATIESNEVDALKNQVAGLVGESAAEQGEGLNEAELEEAAQAALLAGQPPPQATSTARSTNNKKNKGKNKAREIDGVEIPNAAQATQVDPEQLERMLASLRASDNPVHKFWDTQPVPKLDQTVEEHGPVDVEKTVDQVRQDPYKLPGGFHWVAVDVNDDSEIQEVYDLLAENYVEDDDNMFRFDYSIPFLKWALTPPHFHKDWHVGIRQTSNNKLLAFITGVPAEVSSHGHDVKVAEINFLCIHKKLRSKRLAPVLIKEVTRRVNLTGTWQAVYTAGVTLPKPVASCRYWHRSLNPRKLVEVKFTGLHPRMTMNRMVRLHALPETPATPGIRPMEPKDVPKAFKLVFEYLKQFKLHISFTEEDFGHWLLPRENVIESYVVENDKGEITDFASFYHLPSSVIGHPKHSTLYAAYSYYNVATSVPFKQLMNDLLILANNKKVDVFNALDIMENAEVLKDLKFGIGDGHLQFYLYNWKCPEVSPQDVGIVLL